MTPKELKRRRHALGMSQFAVAKLAKVSRYNISLFENGYHQLTGVELNRIDNILTKKEASNVRDR